MRTPVDRDYFINNIAVWLPEQRQAHLSILNREMEGGFSFFREDKLFIIYDNVKKAELIFDLDKKEWRTPK